MNKPVLNHKENFEVLKKAFFSHNVCLMECKIKATGEKVAVICALNYIGDEIEFVPFAQFFNGNPYEILEPPEKEMVNEKIEI